MDIREQLRFIADKFNCKLDESQDQTINRIEDLYKQFGMLICPCGFYPADIDIVELVSYRCPCWHGMERINKDGQCKCGIFKKELS